MPVAQERLATGAGATVATSHNSPDPVMMVSSWLLTLMNRRDPCVMLQLLCKQNGSINV